jgi:hypothetical protein
LIFAASIQTDTGDETKEHVLKVGNKDTSSEVLSVYRIFNPLWIKKSFVVAEATPDALHIDHCTQRVKLRSINFKMPPSKWLLNLNDHIAAAQPTIPQAKTLGL